MQKVSKGGTLLLEAFPGELFRRLWLLLKGGQAPELKEGEVGEGGEDWKELEGEGESNK